MHQTLADWSKKSCDYRYDLKTIATLRLLSSGKSLLYYSINFLFFWECLALISEQNLNSKCFFYWQNFLTNSYHRLPVFQWHHRVGCVLISLNQNRLYFWELFQLFEVCTTWHQRKFSLHWTATLSLLYNTGKEMADHTRLKNLCSGLFKVYFSYTVMQQLVSRSETHIKTMNCSKKLISRESGLFVFVDNSFQTCENGVFCFLKVGCSNLKFTW